MAFRIHTHVMKGEIDNRTRGIVSGQIWLSDLEYPIELKLTGNCLPDLAGCKIAFNNPLFENADNKDPLNLQRIQTGVVGDMTASRKVDIPEVSVEEMMQKIRAGQPVPKKRGNCLYLEWFDKVNGRVVIESTDYKLIISEHSWTMTDEEAEKQSEVNAENFQSWMNRLDTVLAASNDSAGGGTCETESMDEFEWERFMRESDERADKFRELLQKYQDHPDKNHMIAREMGWSKLDDAIDAKERGVISREGDSFADKSELREPNPLTEGKDWIRNTRGHVQHPLTCQCADLAMKMWNFCESIEDHQDTPDPELTEMVQHTLKAGGKLAGALDGLAYDDDPDPGHIVANLKRSLADIHQTVAAIESLTTKNRFEDKMGYYRSEIFRIREHILKLMDHYRRKI